MYYLHKLNHMPVGIGQLELLVVPSYSMEIVHPCTILIH